MPDLTLTKDSLRDVYLNLGRFAKKGPRTVNAVLKVARWSGHLQSYATKVDEELAKVNASQQVVPHPETGQDIFAHPIEHQQAIMAILAESMSVPDLLLKDGTPLRFRSSDLPSADGDDEKAHAKREELAGIVAGLGPLFIFED